MKRGRNLLLMAKCNKKHELNIFNALDIAYEDASQPSTKRSYLAAQNAFLRLIKALKEMK